MLQAGPTEASVGASGFQIWRSSKQKLCITHSGNHHPTYHRTLKDTGQGGPPRDSLGQEVVNRGMLLSVVTRELTLLPGWGDFTVITALRGFRANHWTPLSAVISSTPF